MLYGFDGQSAVSVLCIRASEPVQLRSKCSDRRTMLHGSHWTLNETLPRCAPAEQTAHCVPSHLSKPYIIQVDVYNSAVVSLSVLLLTAVLDLV